MSDQQTLEAAGINYSKGLERFMKNRGLYEKFLTKFLNDASYYVLKGTAGNLSIENLYTLADSITQKIRHGATAEEIRKIEPELDSMYEKVCSAIKS